MFDLQNLFLKEKTFEKYTDEAVLECLLKTAGVRSDVQPVIEKMFDAFGSYKGILEARPEQLMTVPGVTKKMATLISMIVPLARSWEKATMSDVKSIKCTRDAEAFCKSLLMGERNEHFVVIALSAKCNINGYRTICEGTLSEVNAYPRSVMETALNYNAHSVILCHNHPGGTCSPSMEDISSTVQLKKMLGSVGIMLLDHIIVAGSNTYSLVQHGDLMPR